MDARFPLQASERAGCPSWRGRFYPLSQPESPNEDSFADCIVTVGDSYHDVSSKHGAFGLVTILYTRSPMPTSSGPGYRHRLGYSVLTTGLDLLSDTDFSPRLLCPGLPRRFSTSSWRTEKPRLSPIDCRAHYTLNLLSFIATALKIRVDTRQFILCVLRLADDMVR